MGATKDKRRARKEVEVCDYCYNNRVAAGLYRDVHDNVIYFKNLEEGAKTCVCSPDLMCLDPMCGFSAKADKE